MITNNIKRIIDLTEAEQEKICKVHYRETRCCNTCPLKIDDNICTKDISDDYTTLRDLLNMLNEIAYKEIDVNDYIRMDKTEVGDKGESGERK